MKKLILVLLLVTLAGVSWAAITPIRDIQYTTDASGNSPLKDQIVTISGLVTCEKYAFLPDSTYYFVQDANAPWSGIKVYDKYHMAAQGDRVTLTGKVAEYYGVTEITNVTAFSVDSTGKTWILPAKVTTGEIATGGANAEAYEGCLVQTGVARITNPSLGNGEWEIDDGSGPCRVDDAADYFFNPADYDTVQSITGVLEYTYNNTKIEPRLAYDVIEEGPYTRIQRIQQVRYSDLLKTPTKNESDFSYMFNDTVTVRGIVTMPTGLSYAGAGIKFIFAAPEGGPWSALLSFSEDSTAYPTLYEGDEIEMTGYVFEFTRAPSNMTELFVFSDVNIINTGKPLPQVDSIATGDLRWPTTAEQWGNVFVKIGNARVTRNNLQYYLFEVNDGSGACRIYYDSDSLRNYPTPPIGAIAESITGWIYHHYGSYADSSAYNINPLYKEEIVWGAAPLTIKSTARSVIAPAPGEAVTVSTVLDPANSVTSAKLFYKVDEGAYTELPLILGGGVFTAEIPGQPIGSYVSYYVEAEDKNAIKAYDPPDHVNANFAYVVLGGIPSISQIQYTIWPSGDSPFQGEKVVAEGIVTADSLFYAKFGAYPMQDAQGAWNGLYILGKVPKNLHRGDHVRVYGTVEDHNADYLSKWEGNTQIKADSLIILARGQAIPAVEVVKTVDLTSRATASEKYEGVLVQVKNATLTAINQYDVTIDDGSGPCLLDGDAFVGRDQDKNSLFYLNRLLKFLIVGGDTLRVGDQINVAQGIFLYSFGTHKIEIRDLLDIGTVTGVKNAVVAQPLTYALDQNYPNPFNPETRLYFQLPIAQDIKLIIYNVRGQIVRHLADGRFDEGQHVVNWDGRDNTGQMAPTGVYIYRLKAGDYVAARKMTLVK